MVSTHFEFFGFPELQAAFIRGMQSAALTVIDQWSASKVFLVFVNFQSAARQA